MQNDHVERVAELLAELRVAQARLTERQRQLLQAVAADRPRRTACARRCGP
jgi:FixJ family two-component response regulator